MALHQDDATREGTTVDLTADEEIPRVVVKRYRKRTRNASEQHHDGNGCPSVTQPAPLLQSTHKAKANPHKQSPVQYTSRCLACTTMGRAPAFAKEARPPRCRNRDRKAFGFGRPRQTSLCSGETQQQIRLASTQALLRLHRQQ